MVLSVEFHKKKLTGFVRTTPLKLGLAVMLFAASQGIVFAQSDTLSLARAIELAYKSNLNVLVSEIGVKQSESKVQELRASRLPPLLFHSHYLHAPETGYNEIVTNAGEYGVQLSSNFPIYDGGAKGTLIDQSLTQLERSSTNVGRSKVEVAFIVRLTNYELIRAREERRIREETVGRLEDYRLLLERLRLGGIATEGDVLKADVDLNNARIALEQSAQAVQKAKHSLASALGIDIRQLPEIRSSSNEDSLSITSSSIDNNFDLKMLEHDKTSTSYDLAIAKAERLPTLSVAGDIGALGVQPSGFHNDLGYSLFLSLDMPLFSWGAIGDRVEQKELAREQLDAQARQQRRDLETEWNIALSDFAAARKNIATYAGTIAQAEQNYLTAKSRFAGGSGSNLEVLDAQRLLVGTTLDYNSTLFQMRQDIAVILKLSGQP